MKREGSDRNMNGPLYRQASSNVVLVRRIKRKGESPLRQFTRWFVDNQTGTFPESRGEPWRHPREKTNRLASLHDMRSHGRDKGRV